MAFPQEFLDELVLKNDILSVVSAYVPLKENSGRHWGCCPFHGEKTPSFCVQPAKQMYYCFGCKAGGGVVNFIMQIEKLSYPEAVEFLARRANMDMPQESSGNYEDLKLKRNRVGEMNKLAARYFHNNLFSKSGTAALDYLKKRGITLPIVKKFGLGYANESWNDLCSYLGEQGVSDEDMLLSGLAKKKEGKPYDAFRGRVIFPIINQFSSVIGFGGRVLDDSLPKYLNSPETPVFNKRKNLFAANLFSKSLPHIILLEGYMDVISLYANGIPNVTASLGTALTREQAHLLKRYTNNVYISYDGDTAGVAATKKACSILTSVGLNVRIISFDDGQDPDDFIRSFGRTGYIKKMKESRTIADFNLDLIKRDYDMNTLDGKTDYSIAATNYISKIDDGVIAERSLKRLEEETGFSEKALQSRLEKNGDNENINLKNWNNRTNENTNSAERTLLVSVLNDPSVLKGLEFDFEHIEDVLIKKVILSVNARLKKGILPTYAEIISELSEQESSSVSELCTLEQRETSDIHSLLRAVCKSSLERQRTKLKERYRVANEGEKAEIISELNRIGKELKKK